MYLTTKCPEHGNGDCQQVIKNDKGQVLDGFSTHAVATTIAKGRYKNKAYLLYSISYDKHTSYHLIDQNDRDYPVPPLPQDRLDALVAQDGSVFSITPKGIYKNDSLILQAIREIEDAKLQNNPQGDIAAIARTTANDIITSNTKEWSVSRTTITHRGDKKNILSVYPKDVSSLVYALYRYVNVYNKGVILGKAEFGAKKDISGWAINSQNRNVGFDPQVYIDTDSMVHLLAQNSTEDVWLEMTIGYEDIDKLANITPKHTKGFEEEEALSFLVGSALSYIEWKAQNSVKGENDLFDATLDYKIASNTFLSYYMQGRYNDFQLALTYLQSKAEEKGGIQSEASKYLSGVLDINNLFSSTATLRIVSEKGKINAIATIDESGNAKDVLNYDGSVGVSNEITRYSLLVMLERGMFFGVDYTKYIMPSLLGYGKRGDVKFAVFDPKTKIEKYSIEFGYDELSYAKRYETHLSRFYIQGLGGVGLGYIDYSDDVSAVIDDKTHTLGYGGVSSPLTIVLDGSVEFGYIYQERAKLFHGLGISSQIGFRARGTYYFSGSSSDNEDNDDKLTLEYDRYDLWYGPFVSLNVIF